MQIAAAAAANPDWALEQLDRVDAQESFVRFVEIFWHVVSPADRFMRGWAIDAITDHLTAVTLGQIKKLWIMCPPGMGKSLLVNCMHAAWEWGPRNMPWSQWIGWSYSQDLTTRDNVKFRRVITSPLYQRLWGHRFKLSGDQNEKTRIGNDKTGFKIASSVHGLGTGERGHRITIDDGNAPKDVESDAKREYANQWLTETFPSRRNNEDSAMIGIAQRTHEHDMGGVVLEKKELGFEVLCLPMRWQSDHPFARVTSIGFEDPRRTEGELLFPERFSESYLTNDIEPFLSSLGGEFAIACQLQQLPVPRGGGLIKKEWWKYVDEAPVGGIDVRGWDFAGTKKKTSAYTASCKMRGIAGAIFILDVTRKKTSPTDLEDELRVTANADGSRVVQDFPQDPGQAGNHQVMAFGRLLAGHTFDSSTESGDKESRANPFASQVKAGNVFLVRGPWNDAFVAEAAVFSNRARYKDQVDAASRCYAKLLAMSNRKSAPMPVAPRFYAADLEGDDE